MSSVRISISGYIAKNPEEKATKGGTKVLEFSIPHNKGDDTEWYNCAIYGKRADSLSWLRKGMGAHVRGELTLNESNGKIYRNVAVSEIDVFGKEEIPF